jgi:hypothetical protein
MGSQLKIYDVIFVTAAIGDVFSFYTIMFDFIIITIGT